MQSEIWKLRQSVDMQEDEATRVAGLVYVLGQGDCGQLGKGADFDEAKLPALSKLPGDLKVYLSSVSAIFTLQRLH